MTDVIPDRIGAIDGAAEINTRHFSIVLDDSATVQLDDLVVSRQTLPSARKLPITGSSPSRPA